MLGAKSPRRSLSGLVAALILSFAASSARAELLLFYTFNDDSNPQVAIDETGSGNDGSIFVATYTDPGMGRTGGAEARALEFGSPGSASSGSMDSAVSGAFDTLTANDTATIALWILGSDSQPVNQWTFWFGPGRQLGSHAPWSDGTIYFDVAGCCNANQRLSKNEPDSTRYKTEWNHYAFVKDLDTTRIYQNGELW